jgi:hypothetical protein
MGQCSSKQRSNQADTLSNAGSALHGGMGHPPTEALLLQLLCTAQTNSGAYPVPYMRRVQMQHVKPCCKHIHSASTAMASVACMEPLLHDKLIHFEVMSAAAGRQQLQPAWWPPPLTCPSCAWVSFLFVLACTICFFNSEDTFSSAGHTRDAS